MINFLNLVAIDIFQVFIRAIWVTVQPIKNRVLFFYCLHVLENTTGNEKTVSLPLVISRSIEILLTSIINFYFFHGFDLVSIN